jgi:Mg2+ and Co2+ transporter CorA
MAKTALFQARMYPNLNCISIMMSLLTYITGFFMNFELLPILTNYAVVSEEKIFM